MKRIVCTVLLIYFCLFSAGAVNQAMDEQWNTVGGNRLQDALTQEQKSFLESADVRSPQGASAAASSLIAKAFRASEGQIRNTIFSLSNVFLVLVLCAGARGIASEETSRVVTMAGSLAVFVFLVRDFRSVLQIVLQAIEQIGTFAGVLLPVMATSITMTGAVGTATVMQTASIFAFDIIIRLIQHLFAPAVCAYLSIIVVNSAIGGDYLGSIAELLRWLVTCFLKLTITLFSTYLTISCSISSSVDQTALKATRFAVSGSVPVVGGIISDATETMLAGAVLIKNAVGIMGMLCVASICILPFVKAGLCYLLFKAGAAVMSPICGKEMSGLLEKTGNSIGLLLGMLGACCAILFFEMVLAITMVKGI